MQYFFKENKKETNCKDTKIEEKTIQEKSSEPKKETRLGLKGRKDEEKKIWPRIYLGF
jgi:hypothetical protein